MKLILPLLLALGLACPARSQVSIRDSSINMHIVSMGYSFQLPGGDLADRFGWNSMIEAGYAYKFSSNICIGLHGGFIFGNQLEETGILSALQHDNGSILGDDGRFADVRLFERGYSISLMAGKLIAFRKPNPNSGLLLLAGPTFLQHKVRIETIGNTVPQLNSEYKKGYDRLTNGMGLHESFGYYHFGNKYLVNYYFGFEFIQCFSQNRRTYNFDTMSRDDTHRLDLLFGVRAGWMLPLYKKAPHKYYFY